MGQKIGKLTLGTGTIGLSTIASLAAEGVKTIIASDISEKRLEMAKYLGATATFNPTKTKVGLNEFLIDILGSSQSIFGQPMPNLHAAFECSGVPSVFNDALNGLGYRGKLVILAAYSQNVEIDISNVVLFKALSLHGSFAYSSKEMLEVIELVSTGRVDISSIVTHEFSLSDLSEAFEVQANSQLSVKVLIDTE